MRKIALIIIILTLWNKNLIASETRYLITRSDKVNARTGPSFRYVVKFTYIKKGTILKVTNTFEDWYLIEDLEGDEGWVHKNIVISQKNSKSITIKSNKDIFCYKQPVLETQKVFKTSHLVNFRMKSCNENWCHLEKEGISGWCQKKYLWGWS